MHRLRVDGHRIRSDRRVPAGAVRRQRALFRSGIGYNLAAIVGAAFVPTIATWLSHHWGVHSVGLYLGVMAVCCLVAVLSCKETKDVDFTK